MIMTKFKLLSGMLLASTVSFGQINTGNNWSYSIYLGTSNLLGDLGGSNNEGASPLSDIDYQSFQPAIGLGLQRHYKSVTLSSDLTITRLEGNDAFTTSTRASRNLSVRTDLIEATIKAEIHPFKNNTILQGFYVNGGVGGIYFQPRAKLNDSWYNLRPLGTEGQLIENAETYSMYNIVIPFGYGYQFKVGKFSTLKVDITMRKLFTDYIDDVSTTYANANALVEANGSIAQSLANRSGSEIAEGILRGNSTSNDSYFLIGLKFQRSIGQKRFDQCTNFELPSRKR